MSRTTSSDRRHPVLANTAARIVFGAVLGSVCHGAFAQGLASAQQSAPVLRPVGAYSSLEKAFWACDHAATRGPFDTGEAMACSVVIENLKRNRFGGDFEAMLGWWQRNKDAEHRALDAAGR